MRTFLTLAATTEGSLNESKVIKAEPLKSFICRGTRQRSAEDRKLMAMKKARAEQLKCYS